MYQIPFLRVLEILKIPLGVSLVWSSLYHSRLEGLTCTSFLWDRTRWALWAPTQASFWSKLGPTLGIRLHKGTLVKFVLFNQKIIWYYRKSHGCYINSPWNWFLPDFFPDYLKIIWFSFPSADFILQSNDSPIHKRLARESLSISLTHLITVSSSFRSQ